MKDNARKLWDIRPLPSTVLTPSPKGKARVDRNWLAASWITAVGDDALGVPQNLIKKAQNISIFLAFRLFILFFSLFASIYSHSLAPLFFLLSPLGKVAWRNEMEVKPIEVINANNVWYSQCFWRTRPLSSFTRFARKIHSPHRGKQVFKKRKQSKKSEIKP